ncbi:MAG: AtpZ/AtpI family protein [Ignavibacterium sp.]|nr:AtpZ/AtpI family protein [Ignavibacterium sp.]MCX7610658.1 AtpZ/AtpI family protein [Ignavibacterium sp.]MDW8375538.1 AtpZ/AtpI family protein [Ignavibacteriales bacterium]
MNEDKSSFSDLARTFKEVGPYLSIGVQLAATIVLMVFIGHWLDEKYSGNYLFTLIFAVVGILSGLYNLIRSLNYLEKRKKNNLNEP